MRNINTPRFVALSAVLVAATHTAALAAADPALDCEATRNVLLGRYAVCLSRAEADGIRTEDPAAFERAAGDCVARHLRRWHRLETGNGDQGPLCPEPLDPEPLLDAADQCALRSSAEIEEASSEEDTVGGAARGDGATQVPFDLSSGADLTIYFGNAMPWQVLNDRYFTSASAGIAVKGAMVNRGAMTLTPGAADVPIPVGFHYGTGKCVGDADLVADNIKSGMNVFGVLGRFPHSRSLKTGQSTCFGDAGATMGCTGSGQDGELRRGTERAFHDFGNGTINDTPTGLTWEKLTNDGSIHDVDNTYTFAEAMSVKIATLNAQKFGGYSDWRLPNRAEMESLVHLGKAFPATVDPFHSYGSQVGQCPTGCTVTTCNCTQPRGLYWTSTNYVPQPDAAWVVYFGQGGVGGNSKGNRNYVRAVRG